MRRVVSGKAGGIARKPVTGKRTAPAKAKKPIDMTAKHGAAKAASQYGKRADSKGFARGMANKAANKPVAGARGKSAAGLARKPVAGARGKSAAGMARRPARKVR